MDRHQNTPTPRISTTSIRNEPNHSFLDGEKANHRIEAAELLQIVRRRWLPASAVTAIILTGVAISTLKEPPTYQSQTVILVDNNSLSNQVTQGANTPLGLSIPETDLSTQIQILRSTSLIANALKSLSDPKLKLPVEAVASRLSIQQVKDSKVLIVSYRDTDPQRVQAILKTLGDAYVNYSLESRRSRATNGINFIEEQLPEARRALDQSAKTLQEFRKRYGFVDPDSYANSVVATKLSLEGEATQANLSLQKTNRLYQELLRQMAEAGLNPQTALINSMLAEDNGYRGLVQKLQEIDLAYTQESLRFQDNHPTVQNLRTQRGDIMRLLQQRAQKILKKAVPESDLTNGSISSSENSIGQDFAKKLLEVQTELAVQTAQVYSIRQTQADITKRFEQIPPLQRYYAELQRQYQMNSEEVNRFLQKLQEFRINKAEETSPWRILEPPYLPTQPVAPNVKLRILLGLLGSCGLGVLTALLLEWLDTRIKDPEQVKALTGMPILGTIPRFDSKGAMSGALMNKKYQQYRFSPFTESIRALALKFTYLSPKRGGRILALTSAVPQEGKSTTTYNLGMVLADLGDRVLIVDADMHRPSIHKLLNEDNSSDGARFPNTEGLSTAIATDRPWQELIQTGESDYPHILTAGPMPPNPIALLNSQKMNDLLDEWSQAYDYVLIDTPPIVGIADAQSIATKVDAMILVVAMNQPSRLVVNRAAEILKDTQCNIAGLIINKADGAQQGYYYNYYSSYYSEPSDNVNSNGDRPRDRHSHRRR